MSLRCVLNVEVAKKRKRKQCIFALKVKVHHVTLTRHAYSLYSQIEIVVILLSFQAHPAIGPQGDPSMTPPEIPEPSSRHTT